MEMFKEKVEVEKYDDGSNSIIKAQSSAAIEVAVRTANQYPRSVKQFRVDLLDLAAIDEETACECFYSKPVGNGDTASGISVRLAEIILATYGNLMVEARIIGEDFDRGVITAQGKAWDMQKNAWNTSEVSRSILTKHGQLYSAAVIETNKAALCSIAKRNAILGVVPKALIKKQLDQIRGIARGNENTLGTRMDAMLEFFKKQLIKPAQVCTYCGKSDSTELDADDLLKLRGLVNSVKDGDYPSYEEAFGQVAAGEKDDPLATGKHSKKADKPKKEKKAKEPVQQELSSDPTKMELVAAINASTLGNEEKMFCLKKLPSCAGLSQPNLDSSFNHPELMDDIDLREWCDAIEKMEKDSVKID